MTMDEMYREAKRLEAKAQAEAPVEVTVRFPPRAANAFNNDRALHDDADRAAWLEEFVIGAVYVLMRAQDREAASAFLEANPVAAPGYYPWLTVGHLVREAAEELESGANASWGEEVRH